jgi:hypothetical protein
MFLVMGGLGVIRKKACWGKVNRQSYFWGSFRPSSQLHSFIRKKMHVHLPISGKIRLGNKLAYGIHQRYIRD